MAREVVRFHSCSRVISSLESIPDHEYVKVKVRLCPLSTILFLWPAFCDQHFCDQWLQSSMSIFSLNRVSQRHYEVWASNWTPRERYLCYQWHSPPANMRTLSVIHGLALRLVSWGCLFSSDPSQNKSYHGYDMKVRKITCCDKQMSFTSQGSTSKNTMVLGFV